MGAIFFNLRPSPNIRPFFLERTFFDVSQFAFFGKDVVEFGGCHSSSLGVFKMVSLLHVI
ncbi:hypothetical protein SO802_018286 [Lithocarpus litseifolius]|uniref:Uncharacterized protein n=1 Tax=Lithocarpus litseifolius TaxID=425828 RepID=A0AAW2CLK8_9ROSI